MTLPGAIALTCMAIPAAGFLTLVGVLAYGAYHNDRTEREEQQRSDDAVKAAVMAEVEADCARDASPRALQAIWDLPSFDVTDRESA